MIICASRKLNQKWWIQKFFYKEAMNFWMARIDTLEEFFIQTE